MKIALCGIFKNEAPYIVEWVAHHRLLGIDKIYIANNESTDGSDDILRSLQEEGYIEYFNFSAPFGRAPQLLAYQEIINRYSSEVDWMGFIDADEFIVSGDEYHSNEKFSDLMKAFDQRSDVGSIVLNWSIFGSSGNDFYENKKMIERFPYRAEKDFKENHHYKSFFRTSALSEVGANPHFFMLKDGYSVLHINGEEVIDHERGRGLSEGIIWSPFRINHYLLKSKEEFLRKKKPNGSAATLGRIKGRDYFFYHDKNNIKDATSEEYLNILENGIQKICDGISRSFPSFGSGFGAGFDIDELRKDSINFDSCVIDKTGCFFKGWSAIALNLDSVKLSVIFTDSHTESLSFSVKNRPDVFRKGLSDSEDCGFDFLLSLEVMLAHGMPSYIIFSNGDLKSLARFDDKFGVDEWLNKNKVYASTVSSFINREESLSLYENFGREKLNQYDSIESLFSVNDGYVVFSEREVNASPKIEILSSPKNIKLTEPVFLPLLNDEIFPDVNFAPDSVLYKLSNVEIYPDGLIKKDGVLFVESFRNGPSRTHTGVAKWHDWEGEFASIDDTVLYLGGEHFGGYGHFLGEIFSRLWIKKYLNVNQFKIAVDKKNVLFVKELLRLAGIDEGSLLEIERPMQIKSILISSQSHVVRTGFSREGAEFYRNIARSISTKIISKNIYISRRMVSQRNLKNEKQVEGIFRRLGFDIIFPELLTIESQIALFDGCENIAGISGSGFFTSLFGGSNKRKFIITSSAYVLHNDSIMNSYNDCQISYFISKSMNESDVHGDWEVDLRALDKCAQQWMLDSKKA